MDQILDEISSALAARGFEIIRGSVAPPPTITEYPPDLWSDLFARAQVIMVSTRTRLPRAILDYATQLRGVVFPTIGTETVDLADAQELGLVVAHGATPENFLSMAESTVMLIAALFLDLRNKERILRENLPRPSVGALKARMVRGRTIGFVGLGRIARAAVERLRGWEARVLAYDPYLTQDNAPQGVEMAPLERVLAESDLVSLHVTLTPQTRHMIGRAEIARMKPGAYLVNTSRGSAIDEDALVEALQSGHLGGAALDVFEREPLPQESALRQMPNVILTSHMVGHTLDMKDAFVSAGVENIVRIVSGETPLYVRNPDVLPAWRERLAELGRSGR